jgi:hypothetical protein
MYVPNLAYAEVMRDIYHLTLVLSVYKVSPYYTVDMDKDNPATGLTLNDAV